MYAIRSYYGIGLVIGNQAGGMPGAFSAGANLADLSAAAKDNRFDDIELLVKNLVITSYSIHYTKLYEIIQSIIRAKSSMPLCAFNAKEQQAMVSRLSISATGAAEITNYFEFL